MSLRLESPMVQPHICICGDRVTKYAHHGLSTEIPSILEPPGCSRPDGKTLDGMSLVSWARGRSLVWDFTCVDTFALSYLNSTARHVGSASKKKAERDKIAKYGDLMNQFIFVPVALETSGIIGKNGLELIHKIGSKIAEVTNEKRSTSYLIQRISVAIQKGNAASILGTIQESRNLSERKMIFEKLRQYFGAQGESIPMSFVLGFYVTLVVNRLWAQYKLLPWPDTLALVISAAISTSSIEKKEQGRLMRRNIMRYMVLAFVITLMRISLRVKKRFPSWQHLVDSGLMLESEKKIFEIMDQKSPMSKFWMPLVWATNIINTARKQELITSDHIVQTLPVELSDIRRRLGALIGYDTVCVPLVYTQVATLVLYTYFIAAMLGRQMIPKVDLPTGTKYEDPDLYFPLFTALQFVFYVGWLKVAEVLINPFGEDDDDIELNWLIDRHIRASYIIVDEIHEEHPELLRDQYWDEIVPKELPYTVGSEHYRKHEPKGSAENYKVKQNDAVYANISTAKGGEDVYADYESVDTPMVERRKNWFSRQISRMGSVRSSSTAYSSGDVFKRNRNNSVYANPEAVLPGQNAPPPAHKMSLYEKFVNRKSVRNQQRQLIKQNSKLNLNGALSTAPQKNRPQIPTPDVSNDRENRFNLMPTPSPQSSNNQHSILNIAESVALATRKLATEPSVYPTPTKDDTLPIATLQLSPINEMDSGSVNNTLNTNSPTTAELARSVVIPTVTSSGGFAQITNTPSMMRVTLFPKVTNGTSPSHEVSVSIQTMPINSPPSNVVITEIPSDTMVDEVDAIRGRPLSRQSSSLSAAPHVGRIQTISDSSNKSPMSGRQNILGNSSAPSTLQKSTPEQKTGEVYV